ncbi:hypothetical protein KFL_000180620 [Klebsormidium nitens]|uniref:Uncharacterized protein n=1 Tax=Klebsormidium nitens TaxID=105231 RepID=A0A1Y1HJR2_KLENI|nr:hypothetical protein KFL_000180620 [Klebsormidium nitens]|eukprot:GAQ78780.1 hypothetical protein KFL_000180620 [Klebsormidium nitens]
MAHALLRLGAPRSSLLCRFSTNAAQTNVFHFQQSGISSSQGLATVAGGSGGRSDSEDVRQSVPRYRWKEEHLWVAALGAWGVAAYAFSAAREARKEGEKSKGRVAIQKLMSGVKR